jgi:hypothetical protein
LGIERRKDVDRCAYVLLRNYLFIIKKKKGLVIAALTPLVHYSFMLPLGLLLFYTVVKIPWRILYFVFIASFSFRNSTLHR